jgi:multidrug transporter EmrE-like cation transporter
MKLLVAMLPTIFLASYSQLVIKWRISKLLTVAAAQFQSVPERIVAYLLDPFIASAYAFSLLSAIAWFFVVERHPASIAFPVYIGVLFSVVTLGSSLWLKETISIQHLVGLALIVVGIVVVCRAA